MGCLLKLVSLYLLVVICLGISPSVLTAQNEFYSMGAEWDSSAYNTMPYFDWYIGQKGGDSPDKITLRSFCPPVANQGQTGACSGYAFGYGAMSIMYNIQLAKKGEIGQKVSFSPNFVYNQIKKNLTDCTSPSLAEEAISLLQNRGICRFEDFNTQDCTAQPNPTVLEKASAFKIEKGLSVFPNGEPNEKKIAAIKACLQDSMPVVVNIQVRKSFQDIRSNGYWTKPYDEDTYLGKHYLTVIGYDENIGCFEVMNSWGANWAKDGFAYIKYDQLATWCLAAYFLVLPNQVVSMKKYAERPVTPQYKTPKSVNNAAAISAQVPMVSLQGSFHFNHVQKLPDNTIGSENQPVRWNNQKGFYELKNGSITTDKRFQIKATDITRGKFVYIFSCDPTGQVNLHFPKSSVVANRPSVSFIPYSQIELTIPGRQSAFQVKKGDDYLCILYSDEALDIEKYLSQLRQSNYLNKNFSTLLTEIIGEKLIDTKNIRYSPDTMFASVNVQRGKGVAIPIVLKVSAQ